MINFDNLVTYLDLLKASEEISKQTHQGQKYGIHDYFGYHIKGVVKGVEDAQYVQGVWNFNSVTLCQCKIVAYLHDAVEDSKGELTIEKLRKWGFTEVVLEAIDLVTKKGDTVIEDYLVAIRENEIALIVKKADMTFNMTNCILEGNPTRYQKYADQMAILLG